MPKIIHYFYDDIDIWKKNATPQFRMCYASWLKYCPDYEIKLWHTEMPEFKLILQQSKFVRECYKRKLWAFIADYIRYYALYNYGGVYLDTDVQLVKSFDEFIDKMFFASIEGDLYYGKNMVEPAVIGGQKGLKLYKDILDIYNSEDIFSIPYFIAPIILTKYIREKYGFEMINYTSEYQEKAKEYYKLTKSDNLNDYELYRHELITKLDDLEIYPAEYFCPTWSTFGERAFTDKTVAIHWNQSTWWNKLEKIREVEAFKYKNHLKRFWYIQSPNVAKTINLFMPSKRLRRKVRELVVMN